MHDPYFEVALGPEDFSEHEIAEDMEPWEYPIYQDSDCPVLVPTNPQENLYKLHIMYFTLIPHNKKKFNKKFTAAFARRESVLEKRLWQHSLNHKRCLVPITAFFASFYQGEFAGNLMRITHPEEPILYVAGLWDYWEGKTEYCHSFAIITTKATDYNLTGTSRRSPLFVPYRFRHYWNDTNNEIDPVFFERCLSEYAETDWNFDLERKLKSKPVKPKGTNTPF